MTTHTGYPLGTGDDELARLAFQQEVWGGVTERFVARIGVGPGWRVADLGCGPGLLVDGWIERVGDTGSLLLVDEAERWQAPLARAAVQHANVRVVRARLEELELADGAFDLVFLRWVLSFVPEPEALVARLARALAPGGVLAVEDYNHEGISLFPRSPGFEAVIRATRALYAARGGDAFVAGRIASLFRAAGLETFELVPNVLAGGPDSPAFRWAERFFPAHSARMVEEGHLGAAERERFLVEWAARRADPDALFFSPIVVDAAARRARPSAR